MENSLKANILTEVARSSGGRFFGLRTKRGWINAQFVRDTPKTLVVWDRNNNRVVRAKKNDIRQITLDGQTWS